MYIVRFVKVLLYRSCCTITSVFCGSPRDRKLWFKRVNKIKLQVSAVTLCFACIAYNIVRPAILNVGGSGDLTDRQRLPAPASRRAAARPGLPADAVFCRNCSLPTPTSIKRNDPERSLKVPLFGYRYLWDGGRVCGALRYLVAVNSLPENYALRQIMRDRWWPHVRRDRYSVLQLFYVGRPRSRRMRAIVRAEILRYGDLIVGEYDGTPENATLTTLMILKWKVDFCPEAQFLVKVDDGGHLDFHFLRDSYAFFRRHSQDYEMFGSFVPLAAQPCQEPPGDSDMRNCSGSRGYLVGCAYVLTADVVEPLLYAAATEHTPTPPEGLYVTGTLADSVSARRADLANFEGCYVAYAKEGPAFHRNPLYWFRDLILARY